MPIEGTEVKGTLDNNSSNSEPIFNLLQPFEPPRLPVKWEIITDGRRLELQPVIEKLLLPELRRRFPRVSRVEGAICIWAHVPEATQMLYLGMVGNSLGSNRCPYLELELSRASGDDEWTLLRTQGFMWHKAGDDVSYWYWRFFIYMVPVVLTGVVAAIISSLIGKGSRPAPEATFDKTSQTECAERSDCA